MSKLKTIIFSILGACDVLVRIMTPIMVAIGWGYFFNLNDFVNKLILIIGGLAALWRALFIGWIKND